MTQEMMDGRFMNDKEAVTALCDALKDVEVVTYAPSRVGGSRRKLAITGESLIKAVPWAVERDSMGYYNVDLAAIVPALVVCVQELKADLDALKARRRRTDKPEA